MGPVKDKDILKNVKDNNRSKLLKNLAPEKSFNVSAVGVREENVPGGRIRMKLTHVNVDCKEEETGFTPMMLSVLNGNKDILEDLIFHSADVDCQDIKGNTALHMAVFGGQIEMVELLLHNKAKVNLQNSDGNTPLHIVCQTDDEKRVYIMQKLLQHGTDASLENKDKLTALDTAAMYNKTDAVSMLLDHLHGVEDEGAITGLRSNSLAMIESAIRGSTEIVEMLLDYGYDPNVVHQVKDTTALSEAVRFVRKEVAETLLKYGANPDVVNSKNESAESVAKTFLPPAVADQFLAMFTEFRCSGPTQTPRLLKVLSHGSTKQTYKDYPILPNDVTWTSNCEEYCNSCTPNAPNTNILEDDMCSCWIAAEVHHAWTVLDLRHDHILTGIIIYGWDSPQMVRSFQLQKGNSLKGPWTSVFSGYCQRLGNKRLNETGMPQTFTDFTSKSRYWRLELLDNHGGKCICFQGIQLYGADSRIGHLLDESNLGDFADKIIRLGYNTFKKFLLIPDAVLKEVFPNEHDKNTIVKAIDIERQKEFHPVSLSWKVTPKRSVKVGDILPDFSVLSKPGVKTKLKIIFKNGVSVTGETVALLQSDTLMDPAEAIFTGIAIHTAGQFALTVQCIDYPRISLQSPSEIEVKPKPALRSSVAMAFDDMEAMLKDMTESLDPIAE